MEGSEGYAAVPSWEVGLVVLHLSLVVFNMFHVIAVYFIKVSPLCDIDAKELMQKLTIQTL